MRPSEAYAGKNEYKRVKKWYLSWGGSIYPKRRPHAAYPDNGGNAIIKKGSKERKKKHHFRSYKQYHSHLYA